MSYYTSVSTYGKHILVRAVENGRRVNKKVEYKPTLFLPSQAPTKFTTIHGAYVKPTKPGNLWDCKKKIEHYEGIDNFKVYGQRKYDYAWVADEYPDEIAWDRKGIVVAFLDIETGPEGGGGFASPETAKGPVTAIGIKIGDRCTVFGYNYYTNKRNDVTYIDCTNETDMLKRFIDFWSSNYPDVITGWNVDFFDIPYLVNRITNLFDEDMAARLSPWDYIRERRATIMGREQQTYVISGVAVLDYLQLYKKFAPQGKSRESYKLDAISFEEIGEKKLAYEGSLFRLYEEDYQKFIDYNIQDIELIEKLDNKLRLLDLAFVLAYNAKVNFEDVFFQTRMWQNLIFLHLKKNKMVMPPPPPKQDKGSYVGAYVKPPITGMHEWCVSYDCGSLYPSAIRAFNVSPETIIEAKDYDDEMRNIVANISVDKLLDQSIDLSYLEKKNICMAPSGQFFRNDIEGIMPQLVRKMTDDRAKYKEQMLTAKKKLELVEAEIKRRNSNGRNN